MSTYDNQPKPEWWDVDPRPRPVAWLDDYRKAVEDESHLIRGEN